MQSETGFPSSHQLKSYVASKSRLKLVARAVLSADAGLLVILPRERRHTSQKRASYADYDHNRCYVSARPINPSGCYVL